MYLPLPAFDKGDRVRCRDHFNAANTCDGVVVGVGESWQSRNYNNAWLRFYTVRLDEPDKWSATRVFMEEHLLILERGTTLRSQISEPEFCSECEEEEVFWADDYPCAPCRFAHIESLDP